MNETLKTAALALDSKKAVDVVALDISGIAVFARYFLLCTGESSRQVQAIADEVEMRLKEKGVRPNHIEGYRNAEWILMDHLDLVVHVFSRRARQFYDLERLWRDGKQLNVARLVTETPAGKAPASSPRRKVSRKKA
ncbi:MAG: ribosome silencing factor [Acidobacteria bacterium]|nr:ribosome silencing factor [Acidobacteriota bacterium]